MRQIRQLFHRRHEAGHVRDVAHHDHFGPLRDRLFIEADDLIDALWRRRQLDRHDLDADPLLEVLVGAGAAAVLVRAVEHLVAGLPVVAVREDVHAFRGAARQRDLVGCGADELRHLFADLVDLHGAAAVGRVLHDLAHVALVGLEDDARHRTQRAVVHERETVDDVELASHFPPVRLVERSRRFERVERQRGRRTLPFERGPRRGSRAEGERPRRQASRRCRDGSADEAAPRHPDLRVSHERSPFRRQTLALESATAPPLSSGTRARPGTHPPPCASRPSSRR